jgi:hypothetical protein
VNVAAYGVAQEMVFLFRGMVICNHINAMWNTIIGYINTYGSEDYPHNGGGHTSNENNRTAKTSQKKNDFPRQGDMPSDI